jgi:hypothetical protein
LFGLRGRRGTTESVHAEHRAEREGFEGHRVTVWAMHQG